MSALYVGVDGGGTRTRALVVDGDGRELARAEAGASRIDPRDPGRAASVVLAAAHAALAQLPAAASEHRPSVRRLWCGLAGAGDPGARAAVEAHLARSGVADAVTVATDAEAAFADAFPDDRPGILLIAGTGSIAWARNAYGAVARAGGLGPPDGDPGSATAIGHAALRAGVIADPEDGRPVAALAPLVTAKAAAGDPAAETIMGQAAAHLAAQVAELVGHFDEGDRPIDVACAGALVAPDGPLRDALARDLTDLPVRLLTRAVDPAAGAARRARSPG